jgi:hypothetical protein
MPEVGLEPAEKRWLERLREHDLQLAFLALLTLKGVKPTSRWERALGEAEREALRGLGLTVRAVQRHTLEGGEVVETLFSTDPDRLEEYAARFEGRPLDKSQPTRRFEGNAFGYPSCCVEAFVRAPYQPNDLAREDQELLFHWACPGCRETPDLLPLYRELHAALLRG